MRVILAKTAGFCYGVERAVALAHETAKAHGGAMLGSVIHNANVVAELEREGMRLIASPEEAAAGETVLIRSHGESREVLEELQARGAEVKVVDVYEYINRIVKGTIDKGYLFSSKHTKELYRVVYGLGIAGIGLANAKVLCRHFGDDFTKLRAAGVEELQEVDGIGAVLAENLVRYFRDAAAMKQSTAF